MKTRKFLKRLLAGFMSVMMIMSATAVSLFAVDEAEAPKTVWKAKDFTLEVEAGENGYTFLSHYVKPFCNYETSHHILQVPGAVSLLTLVDASHDYTFTPNGPYVYDDENRNYEVLYCCDYQTMIRNGVYYKRINLEDSDYYTE